MPKQIFACRQVACCPPHSHLMLYLLAPCVEHACCEAGQQHAWQLIGTGLHNQLVDTAGSEKGSERLVWL